MHLTLSQKKQIIRNKSKILRNHTFKNQRNANKKISILANEIIDLFQISKIACYWPIKSELSTITLIENLIKKGYEVSLPRINLINKKLEFKVVSTNFQMFKGPFGTLEPDSETLESKPELIFMPLLAFDKDFNRLGYGGGFYDRTIYQFKKKIFKVGIAFDNQIMDNVPVNEFDQKLDAIVTPSRIILGNNYL